MALESGHVIKPTMGWYSRVNKETGEVGDKLRLKDLGKEFFTNLILDKTFQQWVIDNYQIAHGAIISDEEIIDELEALTDD
jgi:hypothetical protein